MHILPTPPRRRASPKSIMKCSSPAQPTDPPPRPATGKYPRIILEFRIGTINGGGAAPNDVRLANLDNDRTVSHQLQLARCCCRYLPMYIHISGAFLLVSKKTVRRTTTTLREGLTACGCLRTFPHGYLATIERGRARAVEERARSSGWCCRWRCCSTGCGLTCQTNELPSGIWNADLVSGYWAEGSDDKKDKKRKKQIQYRFCDERATAIVAVIDCSHPLEGLSLSAPRVLLLLVFLWATSWHERLAPPPFAVHLHTHTHTWTGLPLRLATIGRQLPVSTNASSQRPRLAMGSQPANQSPARPLSSQSPWRFVSPMDAPFEPSTFAPNPLFSNPSYGIQSSPPWAQRLIESLVCGGAHRTRRTAPPRNNGACQLAGTLVRVGGAAPAFDFGAGRDKFDKSWRVSTRPAALGLAGLQ